MLWELHSLWFKRLFDTQILLANRIGYKVYCSPLPWEPQFMVRFYGQSRLTYSRKREGQTELKRNFIVNSQRPNGRFIATIYFDDGRAFWATNNFAIDLDKARTVATLTLKIGRVIIGVASYAFRKRPYFHSPE